MHPYVAVYKKSTSNPSLSHYLYQVWYKVPQVKIHQRKGESP